MFNGEVEFTCQFFQDCFLMVPVLGLDIAKYKFHSLVIVPNPTKKKPNRVWASVHNTRT
jgi:hypothetical protein